MHKTPTRVEMKYFNLNFLSSLLNFFEKFESNNNTVIDKNNETKKY